MTQTWNDVKTATQFTALFANDIIDILKDKLSNTTFDIDALRNVVHQTLMDHGKRLFLNKLLHLSADINIEELKQTPIISSVLNIVSSDTSNEIKKTQSDILLYLSLKTFQTEHPLFKSPSEELLFVSTHAAELLAIQPSHEDADVWTEIINHSPKEQSVSPEFTENYKLDLDQLGKTVAIKPMHAHQEQSEIVSTAMRKMGIDVINSSDWRANKMPREKPVCVTSFEYSTIGYDVGRAAFLLVGPTLKEDIRIEVKTQNSPGTAGDKLPTSIRRLKNADRARAYNRAIVGVLGTEYFSTEALEMAREESSPRVMVVEGLDNFNDALEQAIRQVRGIYALEGTVQAPKGTNTSTIEISAIELNLETPTV